MNIQQLNYVIALAKHRHFESAAEACHISQSTLSTMVSKLEGELGVLLFDRKGKPVELTEEGRAMLPGMQSIVQDIRSLYEFANEIKGECRGELRFSAIPTIAPYVLPDFLRLFSVSCPEIFLTVTEQTTSEIVRKLKAGELDMGLVSIPVKDPELEEVFLYDEPLVLFDAQSMSAGPIDPAELNVGNLCLLEEGHCLRSQVLELCDRVERPFSATHRINFVAGSMEGLLRHVRRHESSTLFPHLATLELGREDRSRIRMFSAPVPFRRVGLVVRKNYARKTILNTAAKVIREYVLPLLPTAALSGTPLMPVSETGK